MDEFPSAHFLTGAYWNAIRRSPPDCVHSDNFAFFVAGVHTNSPITLHLRTLPSSKASSPVAKPAEYRSTTPKSRPLKSETFPTPSFTNNDVKQERKSVPEEYQEVAAVVKSEPPEDP
jgi:hypothetical protein